MATRSHVVVSSLVVLLLPLLECRQPDLTSAVVHIVQAMPIDSLCTGRCSVVLLDPGIGAEPSRPGRRVVMRLQLSSGQLVSQPQQVRVVARSFDPRTIGSDSAGLNVFVLTSDASDSVEIRVEIFGSSASARYVAYGMVFAHAVRRHGVWSGRYRDLMSP
jgi:hypothetical protein